MRRSLRTRVSSSLRRLRMPLASLLLLAGLVGPLTASAQEQHRLSVDQVLVLEQDEGLTALVSVLDPAGQPLLGLTTFEAQIDGVPIPLASVQPVINEEAGIAVLLLIDVSGSMEGGPLAEARAAAASFVERLLAQDIAAVLAFGSSVPAEATFTAERDVLLAGIGSLEAEEHLGTVLYDAVAGGLSIIGSAPNPRRAIVLLTDGQDSAAVSGHTRDEALQAAATAGLPIFAIALGQDADVEFLQRLASDASGGFFRAPTPADVPGIFEAISATLRSQYALALPLPPADRAERELLVSLDLEGTSLTAQATFLAPDAVIDAGPGGDGLPNALLPASIVLALLLGAAVGVVLVRRRLRRRPALAGGPGHDTTLPIRPHDSSPATSIPAGRLRVVAGPNTGASAPLAAGPIEIGRDPAAGLRLDDVDDAVAATHARAWLQSGRLLLHHLARGRQTLVGEKPIEWATLEPNDTLRIGPHVIAFALDG